MPIFAIMTSPNNPKLGDLRDALDRVFPHSFYRIDEGQFVASKANVTSEQVSKQMGAQGEIGQFVVFTTAGYFGWHNQSLWEWLATRGPA